MAIRQRKDGRWVVYYRAKDGSKKIKEEYFGRGPEGEQAAITRNDELGSRSYTKPKTKSIIFYELARAYIAGKNFAPNPKKHLKIRLEANILPFFKDLPAIYLTDSDMDRYVQYRLNAGVKYSTITRELTDVKAILNWAARRHPPMIPRNPVRDYKKPKTDDAIIYPPTRKEMEKILAAAKPHLKRAIIIASYTGLRPGAVEMLTLTWGAVDWEEQTIHIMSAHKGGPIRREVPLHSNIFRKMKQWYKNDIEKYKKKGKKDRKHEISIINFNYKPIKAIKTTWKQALSDAGITRRIRPYDLRHEFITRALENGADLKTVSEIVGSSPKTIHTSYQHVSNKLKRKTIDGMTGLRLSDDD